MDDQAETMVMRFIKGASLRGLCGIPPVRTHKNIKIIRPLLEIQKKDIVAELRKQEINFRTDESNSRTVYFRNAVRLEVLPFLSRYNPRIHRTLALIADTLSEDYASIKQVNKSDKLRREKNAISIPLADFVMQPALIQKTILREVLQQEGANIKKLTHRHWQEIRDLISSKRTGKTIQVPGRIQVTRTKQSLLIGKRCA